MKSVSNNTFNLHQKINSNVINTQAQNASANRFVQKHSRTNSNSSYLSVIDLNDDEKAEWSFYTTSQSLSSVLNDPNIGRNISDQIFTKDWGSYFTDTVQIPSSNNLCKVVNRKILDEYSANLNKRLKFKKNLHQNSNPILGLKNHKLDLKSIDEISIESERNKKSLKNFNLEKTIPKIFLKEDFNLNDFETFKEVFYCINNENLLEELTINNTSKSLPKNSIKNIEQSLTDQLDFVEEHLASQISVRFRDFFQIMVAMNSVMDQLKETIAEVTFVRNKCNELQKTLVYPSLKNIQLTKKRENLKSVYEKVRIMAAVHETRPTIQSVLSSSDYVGALDLITTTQEVYNQDLIGLNSFQDLGTQLQEIQKDIYLMMQKDFIKFTTQEWNRPLTDIEKENNIKDDSLESLSNSFNSTIINDEEKLISIILGMLRVQRINFINIFKEEAFTTINLKVKETIIEILANEDDCVIKKDALFKQASDLSFKKWLNLLNQIFENLYIILNRVHAIHKIMKKTVDMVENSILDEDTNQELLNTTSNNKFDLQLTETIKSESFLFNDKSKLSALHNKLKECMNVICEKCNKNCKDFIKAKGNSLLNEEFDDIIKLVKMIENFTIKCERICDKRSPTLRLVLQEQTNRFVERFHKQKEEELRKKFKKEKWKSCDNIKPHFQQLITDIIDYNYSLHEVRNFKKQVLNSKTLNCSNYLIVNSEKFVIVPTFISLVNMIIEYCTYATEINIMGTNLLSMLLDLLKMFDSEVYQLFFYDNKQVADLKTITSRNLLIASRCLTLVVILIPYLKNHFNYILKSNCKSMLNEFENIKESYVKHIQEIKEKVITVAQDVLIHEINKWKGKPPVPSIQFKTILQHLQTLYTNIEDTLPGSELSALFIKIHFRFKELLRKQLINLKIINDGGPQHFLVTQELTFYKDNFKFSKKFEITFDDVWVKT